MGYTRNAISGVSWIAAFRGLTRVITLLRIIVIARFFLNPYQFGLFAIASLVLTFIEVVTETGVNVFLIQLKDEIEEYISSAWIVSIIRGVIIAICIIALAIPISTFYALPDSAYLIFLIAIVPFIKGFINPAEIRLQKELTFKKEFYFRSSLLLIETIITLFFAYLLKDPSCFIYGFIASALFEVIISHVLIRPRPRLQFDKKRVLEILHHGKWVTMYGVFSYLAENGDNMVVGKLLGATPLALYQTGYKLSTLPVSEVTDVVSKVVFPVYSKITDDKERLFTAFIKTTAAITVGATMLGSIILLFPTQIVLLTLGDKWIGVAPILGVLTVYGILRAISGSVSSLFLAVGRQNYVAAMTFVRFASLAITIVPFTLLFGLKGAGFSALTSVLFEIPVITYYSRKVFAR